MGLVVAMLMFAAQSQTLTITVPPTPAPKAIALIAKASGKRLAVAPVLADEVILARLKDAPLDTALRHLGEALCAKWVVRRDGITWLEPDLAAQKSMEQAAEEVERAKLLDSLKRLSKRLSKQPVELDSKVIEAYRVKMAAANQAGKDGPVWQTFEADESPVWRALARIVLQMDPKPLMAMSGAAREVWAEDPTPMQHAFSDEAQEILQRYRRELNLVDPTRQPKRVKLVARKFERGFLMLMTLEATDAAGKILESAFVPLTNDSDEATPLVAVSGQANPKPVEQPVLIPVEAEMARKALASSYPGKDRLAIQAKWRFHLLDPIKYEPLQWHRGLDLVMAAELADKQIIGTVSDTTNSAFWEFNQMLPSQIFADGDVKFVPSDDGWLIVRGNESSDHASRAKARDLIVESVRVGGISLDAAADWTAHSSFTAPFLTWVGDYLCALHSSRGSYSAIAGALNFHNLRLWASLGPGVREALRRGDTVDLSQLSSDAKDQVAKMVYVLGGLDENSIEPTDKLPNGIAGGALNLKVTETPVFIGWSSTSGPSASPMPLDAKMFGTFLAQGFRGIPTGVFQQYDQFKFGVNRAYQLNFTLNPGALPMTLKLTETFFPPDQETKSELPSDIKVAVEKVRSTIIANPPKAQGQGVIPP